MKIDQVKKHVLIVDDSLDQQMLLKILLESRGYTIDCTQNGEDALKLLYSMTKMPQIILLDLNMPQMGGLDFRQVQRSDPILKDIPVVIMSGEEDVASFNSCTHAEVLTKPLTILALMEALERNMSVH